MRFFDFLFPPRVDELVLRTISIDEFMSHIAPRMVPDTRPHTVSLLPFSLESVRAALHEAKYHGSERAFSFLGQVLAEYLRDADDIGRHPVLIPVPLSNKRRERRGFNQVEEIIERAIRVLPHTINTQLLARTRDTESQVSLPRHKRETNMKGAFVATRALDPSLTYILIDDVLTTGATLQAAIDALKAAGAEHIVPIALAH